MDIEIRRKTYIVALMLGAPTVPLIWFLRGPEDDFIFYTYPIFTIYLFAVAGALWARKFSVRQAERYMVCCIGGLFLLRVAASMWLEPDLVVATEEMLESTYWGLILVFIVAYLAYETKSALKASLLIYLVALIVIGARLISEVIQGDGQEVLVTHLRVLTYLGAAITLLYALARAKDQLIDVRAMAESMRVLANTDGLTRVANRRKLEEMLSEWIEKQAERRDLSVLLIDLDEFKRINDRHGHATGDLVLQESARILGGQLRSQDLVGRWGGEEFMVIAPDTSLEEGQRLAERCREVLADHLYPALDAPVTASIGVATIRPGDTVPSLVHRADDALYEAKRRGRNQVCLTA